MRYCKQEALFQNDDSRTLLWLGPMRSVVPHTTECHPLLIGQLSAPRPLQGLLAAAAEDFSSSCHPLTSWRGSWHVKACQGSG